MEQVLLTIGERAITMGEAILAVAGLATLLLLGLMLAVLRGSRARVAEAAGLNERTRELDDKLAAIERLQAEMKGGVEVGLQSLDSRQSALARFVSERVEGLQHRVSQGLAETAERTGDNLIKLNERLAVIDAAQRNLTDLTGEIVGLKDILANKQARGAYGQGRMEAIIRDGLPPNAYTFQATLNNNKRPDCLVHLPGDHPLVIDAKFPLEGFVAFRDAQSDEARKAAAGRVKTDIGQHVRDMADRYLVPGETQDMALLFVPSEALYADLHEHFADVVERAHRQRIIVVSPSLLALAVQLVKSLVRDARMREEAQKIQLEVGRLLDDVGRLRDRVGKLDNHFRQAQEDVTAIGTSTEKITKRGERIEALEFDEPPTRSLSLVRPIAAE
jgi:DNA recombination protein RmuC